MEPDIGRDALESTCRPDSNTGSGLEQKLYVVQLSRKGQTDLSNKKKTHPGGVALYKIASVLARRWPWPWCGHHQRVMAGLELRQVVVGERTQGARENAAAVLETWEGRENR